MPSAQLTSAAGVAAVAAVLTAVAVSRANRRRRRRAFDDAMPCGLARVERHRFVLPGDGTVPELALDLSIAPATTASPDESVLILYVLDPEPSLFGAAALHAYSGSGYFASAPEAAPEARYRRLCVVGIGHAREAYGANARGWDAPALRVLRRRDYPPYDHAAITPGHALNAHAARLASAFATSIFPHVERELLGLRVPPARRALLGASYTATLALQVLLRPLMTADDC